MHRLMGNKQYECNEDASHCIHVLCAGQFSVLDCAWMTQNGSAACLDHVQVFVRPEQHTLWKAGNPCISLYLFIYLNLKVVTKTSSGFLHSRLLSSSNHQFQPVIKYVANVAQAATDAQNNQYLRGHLFPGKAELSVLQTSLLPVPRAVPLDPYLPVLQSWAKLWAWFTIIGFRLFIKILRLSSMH